MNPEHPAPIEDRYRGPASDEPAADTSRLSKEEWRYAAKVFATWFLGGSVLWTLILIWQSNWALSQFGGQQYLARVVVLQLFNLYGAGLPIAAACITLVMVTELRVKAAKLEPVHPVPWWIGGCLGLTTPVAMALILGLSLAIITYGVGVPWADSWKGIQVAFGWSYFASAILSVVSASMLLVVLTPRLMRLLLRFRGWVILKCIVLMNVIGLVLHFILSMWNAILSP
jgi:hypothetical protein